MWTIHVLITQPRTFWWGNNVKKIKNISDPKGVFGVELMKTQGHHGNIYRSHVIVVDKSIGNGSA